MNNKTFDKESLSNNSNSRLFDRNNIFIENNIDAISIIKENIKDIKSSSEPVGKLRVASTNAFGALWITPRIKKFISMYPHLLGGQWVGWGRVGPPESSLRALQRAQNRCPPRPLHNRRAFPTVCA